MASSRHPRQQYPRSSGAAAHGEEDAGLVDAAGAELAIYNPEEVAQMEEQMARDQAELAMTKAVLGSVFSVRKPRDVVAGTSSGLKTVARGVGLGLASLVAQPYIGAKTGGAKGFIKGVAAGTLTCVASSVTGTVVGTGQIVRGVVNTPNAIMQKARGQVWNSEERKWETDWYSLPEEELEVFGAAGASSSNSSTGMAADSRAGGGASSGSGAGPRRPQRNVVDRTLYNLLEVPPEATDAEIRRAFYKKSLALHPDKNPNNPEATQKFQAVSDAYRVLGDADRRRAYDEHGQDSASAGLPRIEPAVFFAALFGSHHFEPYIGRLKLAQEIDGDLQALFHDAVAGSEDEPPSIDILKVHRAQQQLKVVERQRQVRCAVALARRLDAVVGLEGEELAKAKAAWDTQHTNEIAKLAQVPCGVEMMFLIGWVYANRARQFFAGGMLRRVMAKVEGEVHLAQSKAKLVGSIGRTCVTVNGAMKSIEKKKKSLAAAGAKKGEEATASGTGSTNENGTVSDSDEESEEAKAAPQDSGKCANTTPGPAQGANSPAGAHRSDAGGEAARPSAPAGPAPAGPTPPTGPAASASAHEDTADVGCGETGSLQDLAPGCLVMLRGLKSTPELNDEVGMVCGFEEDSGRYLVQILPDIGLKKLKRENLLVLEAPEPGIPEGNGASSSSATPGSPSGGDANGEDQWAPGGDDAEMADAFKDCMPLFHDAFWSVTALDVEFTLGKVIQRVLRDMSVDRKARRQRADALLKLGNLLQGPMKERRRTAGAGAPTTSSSGTVAAGPQPSVGSSNASVASKKSVLARFRPRTPWQPSAERRTQKARQLELKQKRMEAALAMMAAGASTEDVDEMAAARAAMEAETGGAPF